MPPPHWRISSFTAGLSPIAFADAYLDWASHLAFLPGKRYQLLEKAIKKIMRFGNHAAQHAFGVATKPCIVSLPQDHRFDEPAWQEAPFNRRRANEVRLDEWKKRPLSERLWAEVGIVPERQE